MRSTALALWAAIAGWLTLRSAADSASAFAACLWCGDTGTSDFLLNVGLFVPLGAALVSSRRSVWWALMVGTGVSILIELLQLLFVGGRTVSPGDVLANGSGAFIGALLVHHSPTLLAPSAAQRRTLMAAWLVCSLVILGAGWWSSLPWFPDGAWFLQRAPSRAWADDYRGALHFAGVGNTDLASDAIRDSALVHDVRSGAQDFTVVETPGRAPERIAYTARLVEGGTGLPMATFARRGDALVMSRNHNASRARIATLGVLIPEAYRGLQNDTVSLRMNLVTGSVAMQSPAGAASRSLPAPSPLRAWSWFWPTHRDLTDTQRLAADILWAVLLLLPLAWWWRVTPLLSWRATPLLSSRATPLPTSRASTPASDRARR